MLHASLFTCLVLFLKTTMHTGIPISTSISSHISYNENLNTVHELRSTSNDLGVCTHLFKQIYFYLFYTTTSQTVSLLPVCLPFIFLDYLFTLPAKCLVRRSVRPGPIFLTIEAFYLSTRQNVFMFV